MKINGEKAETVIVASGYFDPVHIGHVEYLVEAKKLGTHLIVILNTDVQAIRKKGYCFMPFEERKFILEHLEMVDEVVPCIDEDQSVCKTLEFLCPQIFAKGGDRNKGNIPEREVCEMLGIKIIDGLGIKKQSSSKLVGGT